jgi:ABC-type multidrug transport system ATPase subunit
VVSVHAVSKRYRRGPTVLDRVTLDLPAGRVTVITGGNGSGKSTLLRVVAGVITPTSGRVRDRPRTVGYLPERFPSGLRLPATAYLRHLAAIRRAPADPALALLDRLAFQGDRTAPLATLSKGNTQKVALAQALFADPDLLVLDEPWSGLDEAAADTLGGLLAAAVARGATVLVTDHRGHARTLPAARVHRLRAGRLATADTPGPRVAVRLAHASDHLTVLRALPGVEHATPDDGLVALLVAAEHSDRVLAEALRLGCSVRTVDTQSEAAS